MFIGLFKLTINIDKACFCGYSAPVEVQSIVINLFVCLSVCLSVCPRAYLCNRWTDLYEILCADLLWPWLGPLTDEQWNTTV